MSTELQVLRGMEVAAESFARLDEAVSHLAAGLAPLLMLRSAQAIVAARPGPLATTSSGPDAFAALLGRWYAAESREFVPDNRGLRHWALALDATAGKIRGGRLLTLALIHEGMDDAVNALAAEDVSAAGSSAQLRSTETPGSSDAAGARGASDARDADTDKFASEALEEVLQRAEGESWPSLLLAAELLSGEYGTGAGGAGGAGGAWGAGLELGIARAVAPLVGGLSADVFVVVPQADDVASALHALAAESRAMLRRVNAYGDQCARAAERARDFGRGAGSALALLELLGRTPAITVVGAAAALELTLPTVGAAVERLVNAGLLREITGRGRDRVFVYEPAIALAV